MRSWRPPRNFGRSGRTAAFASSRRRRSRSLRWNTKSSRYLAGRKRAMTLFPSRAQVKARALSCPILVPAVTLFLFQTRQCGRAATCQDSCLLRYNTDKDSNDNLAGIQYLARTRLITAAVSDHHVPSNHLKPGTKRGHDDAGHGPVDLPAWHIWLWARIEKEWCPSRKLKPKQVSRRNPKARARNRSRFEHTAWLAPASSVAI